MPNCSHCGAEVEERERFCSHCGKEINPVTSQETRTGGPDSSRKKAFNPLLILLALSVLVLVTIIAFKFIGSKNSDDTTDTTPDFDSSNQANDDEPSLPELRLITFGGEDSSVKIYERDRLLWDSEQGELIGCVGENLYYKVEQQLRYVKLGEYEPVIVDREFFYSSGYSAVGQYSQSITDSDYILTAGDNHMSHEITDFMYMFNAATGGDNPDIIKFQIPNSQAHNMVSSCTYCSGWLYFTIWEGYAGFMYKSLYRLNIDEYKFGDTGRERFITPDDVELINSYFKERNYEVVGDYIYFPRENMAGEDLYSGPDRLCARKNLITGKEELIYEFPEFDGFGEFVELVKMLRIGDYIVFFGEYEDGDFESHQACFYNTRTNSYEIEDAAYLLENPYMCHYHTSLLHNNGAYALGVVTINPRFDKKARFYKIETDGHSITVKDIDTFETKQIPLVLQSGGEIFLYVDPCLYYLDQTEDELIAYDNEIENLGHIQIVEK